MSRPRIVFCYRYGLLGGVSAQLLNRYPYLSREYDVSIVYESDYGMASRFPAGVARLAPTVDEMRDVLRELKPDVVVIIDSPKFFEAWRAAGSVGRLVLEVHTTTANITYLHEREQLEGVAHIVTVSSYMEKLLGSYGLTDLAPVTVVPNCLDERWAKPSPEVRLDGAPALWVGKLDGHKRWRTAVDIMDDLAQKRDDVLPIIVGGLTANQSEVQALTTRLATSPGLARAVWLPRVEYDRMPALYTSVGLSGGVHICTTTNESFGMAVAESLVRGCPVVAPAVGALPELLPSAALFPPGDWAAARERAARAMADQAYRQELLSTVDHVRSLTTPERVLDAYRTVISAVLAGRSGDGAPLTSPPPSAAPATIPAPSQPVESAPAPTAAAEPPTKPDPAPEPPAAPQSPAASEAARQPAAPEAAQQPAATVTPTPAAAEPATTSSERTPAAPAPAPASAPAEKQGASVIRQGLVGAPATGPVAVINDGPRSPIAVVGLAECDLAPQPIWLDTVLVPGEVYRLRALTVGGDNTREDAALVRFEVSDGAPDGGRGLTLSKTIGPYTYLATGPGPRTTDIVFTVVKRMHRVGVMGWDNRGPVRIRTLVIEKVQSPRSPVDFFLSFDVEALPARAPSDWVQRLVWGKLDTGSYGIGRICDVVEQHGLRANFMIDYSSCERDGEAGVRAIVDFLRERGHEVHLHLHSEWLARWWGLDTDMPVYLDNSSYDMSRRMLDYTMRRHEQFTGERARVFRAGGYRVNPEFVLAAGSLGLEALTNIRDDMLTDPLSTARRDAREPFVWDNGVVEIPVDLSPEPLSDSFEKYLGRFDAVVPRKQHERTFNLVMHSWSLMRRNAQGHHDAFEPVHEERLHQICQHIVQHGRARLYGEYLDQRHLPRPMVRVSSITIAEPEPRLVPESIVLARCNVCDAVFDSATMVATTCPGCGCRAAHRQLKRVLDTHGNVFDGRSVLSSEPIAVKRLSFLDGASRAERHDGELLPAVKGAADGSFDAVLALDAFNQAADVSSLVSGIARVLTTGGVFVTTVPATSPDQFDGAGVGLTGYLGLLSTYFTVSSWPSIDPVTDETAYILLAYKS